MQHIGEQEQVGAVAERTTDVTVWSWLVNVDPFVRQLSVALVAAGLGMAAWAPIPAVLLLLAGPAIVRWSKQDAVARWHEKQAVAAAIEDLERRLAEGQLKPDAYDRRRDWITATAGI